nr:MAG TPA: hypothetical protein [Caudoviricetes sp.]
MHLPVIVSRQQPVDIDSLRRKPDGSSRRRKENPVRKKVRSKEAGPNEDRHQCRTCIYRACRTGLGGCNYIGVEGHSRGCTVENCTVYVKGRKRKRALW